MGRDVNEICDLWGFYAAHNSSFVATFRENPFSGSRIPRRISSPSPETSVPNERTAHNFPNFIINKVTFLFFSVHPITGYEGPDGE
jgi:hypothetical protein